MQCETYTVMSVNRTSVFVIERYKRHTWKTFTLHWSNSSDMYVFSGDPQRLTVQMSFSTDVYKLPCLLKGHGSLLF